ncbi:hypothetical protein C8K38_111186 [Rhodococcus sp. OK611]|uniref:hypothetical protein n=1 Tax=unclassified Rhodococcus (in: high G+C Gram-positive bacteria) TaxID=192944 RepID=UPI000BC908B1|nr:MULTISPECIES: hypothetical protein [unclassified Rhodococcus (in: high G+C Gram-positive bacteria)]PTR42017.1 hypothetical protein C8K38_111186 [Rhodococcus sp. OK611]SNX91536.1 hypothetical protein SAMN05447004_11071 [Rhodococcus sp. OK270]
MTIITEDFADAALTADEVRASFYGVPLRVQSDGEGVITPTPVVVHSVGGTITSPELDPGPMRVEIDAEGWYQTYDVMIPETGTHRLFELEEIIIAEHKVIVKGDKGDVGAGVNLAGTVANYAELAGIILGPADAGTAYVNNGDGLLYVWSGSAWPASGDGAAFRGLQGKSLASVAIQGNKLLFGLDDSTALGTVTVPALAQAATDAAAAHADRLAAETARGGAETAKGQTDTARDAAIAAKSAAEARAIEAAAEADDALAQAQASTQSATAAGASAAAAATTKGQVDTIKGQIDATKALVDAAYGDTIGAKDAAVAARNAAQGFSTAAGTSATNADASADAADVARIAAELAAEEAQNVGGVPTSRTVTGTGDIEGGGDLSANRTYDLTAAAKVKLAKGNTASQPGHTHEMSEINGLADEVGSALAAKEDKGAKGQPDGYMPLDSSGKAPAAFLPSFVDDVLEFANLAAFPATGESGKIYTALDTNRTYRWSGSAYIEISPSPGSTDAVPEGTTNKYYTDARAQAANATAIGGRAANASGQTNTIWVGTQAAFDALSSGVKNALGFIGHIY